MSIAYAITEILSVTFRVSPPYLLAVLGEVIDEKAGVMNVGIEGCMLMGAVTSFIYTYQTGDYLGGFLVAALVGALIGLVMAYLCISRRMDQVLIGMLIWLIGIGLSTLIYRLTFGVTITLPTVKTIPSIPIPGLSQIPIIGPSIFSQNLIVYISFFILVPLLWFITFKTTWGLKLRAVGENPRAADVLGVNVTLIRYIALIFSATMCSIAGAYLPLVEIGAFTVGMTAGRGWIALQLVSFCRWNPGLSPSGVLLFAFIEALAYRIQAAYPGIPYQFVLMSPYIATIVAMIWVFRGAIVPRALGIPYAREEVR